MRNPFPSQASFALYLAQPDATSEKALALLHQGDPIIRSEMFPLVFKRFDDDHWRRTIADMVIDSLAENMQASTVGEQLVILEAYLPALSHCAPFVSKDLLVNADYDVATIAVGLFNGEVHEGIRAQYIKVAAAHLIPDMDVLAEFLKIEDEFDDMPFTLPMFAYLFDKAETDARFCDGSSNADFLNRVALKTAMASDTPTGYTSTYPSDMAYAKKNAAIIFDLASENRFWCSYALGVFQGIHRGSALAEDPLLDQFSVQVCGLPLARRLDAVAASALLDNKPTREIWFRLLKRSRKLHADPTRLQRVLWHRQSLEQLWLLALPELELHAGTWTSLGLTGKEWVQAAIVVARGLQKKTDMPEPVFPDLLHQN